MGGNGKVSGNISQILSFLWAPTLGKQISVVNQCFSHFQFYFRTIAVILIELFSLSYLWWVAFRISLVSFGCNYLNCSGLSCAVSFFCFGCVIYCTIHLERSVCLSHSFIFLSTCQILILFLHPFSVVTLLSLSCVPVGIVGTLSFPLLFPLYFSVPAGKVNVHFIRRVK